MCVCIGKREREERGETERERVCMRVYVCVEKGSGACKRRTRWFPTPRNNYQRRVTFHVDAISDSDTAEGTGAVSRGGGLVNVIVPFFRSAISDVNSPSVK